MPTPTTGSAYSNITLPSSSTVSALLGGEKWGALGAGTGASISYSFPSASSSWSTNPGTGYGSSDDEPWSWSYRPLDNAQQNAFRSALQAWADVADIQVEELADTDVEVGDIRVAFTLMQSSYSAWAYYPAYGPRAGDVWLNVLEDSNDSPAAGNFGYMTLLHELGHALGLKHSFETETGNPYTMPSSLENRRYTVMSYTDASVSSVEPSTPMLYDIQAIQYLYGANTRYHTGNNTYSFSASGEEMLTIWDAGGADTIDAGNQTLNATIDLRAGTYSSIGTRGGGLAAVNNIAIAFNVTIENAIGGNGHDLIHGNSAANTLIGGGGDDTIYTDGGDDTVVGGGGGDTVHLGDLGGVVGAWEIEAVVGGAGFDLVMLNSVTLHASGAVDALIGSAGTEIITLQDGGMTVIAAALETLIGGTGIDRLNMGNRGSTTVVSGVEIVIGSLNTDIIVLADPGATLIGVRLETLIGSAGADHLNMGNLGSTTMVSGVEMIIGGLNTDVITLADPGDTILASGLETLIGGAGTDRLNLGNLGSTTVVSGVDIVIGGLNTDVVTLADLGATLIGVRLETLIGGAGTDRLNLGNLGSTTVVSGIEIVIGGLNTDVVTLADPGATLIGVRLETLIGGAGTDRLNMGNLGSTTVVSGVEITIGGLNTDVITLADVGATLIASRLETLIGGAGSDRFLMGNLGSTTVVSGIEEIFGSLNTDLVTLGSSATSLRVQGIETLTGSGGNDGVTVADGGGMTFIGGQGADAVILTAAAAVDVIGFTDAEDGGGVGAASGFDRVTGFQSGTDAVAIGGGLRSLLDRNGDGVLTVATWGGGGAVAGTDELVVLDGTMSALADSNLASIRSALGAVRGGVAASLLVMGHDATSTALYLVSENGDGAVAASEVRLLSRFEGSLLAGSDIRLA